MSHYSSITDKVGNLCQILHHFDIPNKEKVCYELYELLENGFIQKDEKVSDMLIKLMKYGNTYIDILDAVMSLVIVDIPPSLSEQQQLSQHKKQKI